MCGALSGMACANRGDRAGAPQQPAGTTAQPGGTTVQKAEGTAGQKSEVSATDTALLKAFDERVKAYMKLHEAKESGSAELKETKDPAKIKAAQDALYSKIAAARVNAKHGDVFTIETRQLFRRLMYPELKGPDGAETKKAIKEDGPAGTTGKSALKVNGRFPEGQPLPTVPPNILLSLPKLPDGLEYRIIGKDLVLRDVNANLIVDFIPNAIQ